MFNGFNISTISECYFGNTPATAIYYGSTEVWSAVRDYSKEYLTFESLADNNNMRTTSYNFEEGDSKTFQYSTDKVNWTTVTVTSASQESVFITLNRGDKIYLRGNETTYGTTAGKRMRIGGAKNINIYGNIMSLIYGDNFTNKTSFPSGSDSNFRDMFAGSHAVDTENLILPATTLTESCYLGMFYNVSTLTKAPALPATTLASSCYSQMFYGCSSLKTAPDLLATTLYQSSYNNMFRNCTSLTYIKCLATSISASNCTLNWVMNVSPRGTFVMDDSMSYTWTTGNSAIPTGWVTNHDYSRDYLTFTAVQSGTFSFSVNNIQYSLDNGSTWTTLTAGSSTPTVNAGNKIIWKATGLTPNSSYIVGTFSATGNFNATGNIMSLYYGDNFVGQTDLTGKNHAFRSLFQNCTKLQNIYNLTLPATTLSAWCYRSMFQGCTSITTLPKELPANTLSQQCYQSMFQGCTGLTIIPNNYLHSTAIAYGCYMNMFQGCTSLTTAPELPATTLYRECYQNLFKGCTSLTTSPELPATTLVDSCYRSMFQGCSKLNYIKCLATDISASNCTLNWVMNVSPRGTFVMDDSMSYTWTTGDSAIPTGWVQESNFDYSQEYLTIESLANNNVIKFYQNAPNSSVTIPYLKISWSTDKTTWNEITGSTGGTTLTTLSNGQKLYIKGSNNYYATGSAYNNITWFSHFTSSGNINLSGNIMSLLNSQQTGDFRTEKYIPNNQYTFAKMFSYSSSTSACKVVNAKNLVLPATTTRTSSYNYMFQGTTTLVTPPKIGMDKNASNYVCFGMFSACTALKYAPELNATAVNQGAYRDMFSGCTSLVSVPTTLPATTLGSECYRGMFYNCDALTYSPILPATTLATYCYQQMFQNCDALTTAPALPAMTLTTSCYQSMFQGCTALTTSPRLAATTLGSYCYYRMFYGCTSLNNITCLATSGINTNNSTTDWVYKVAASGTFNQLKGASWGSRSTSTIPSGWTVNALTA